MVTSLVDRRRLALNLKQEVLTTSLQKWLERSAGRRVKTDLSFEIHFTQTREVDDLLRGLVSYLKTSIDGAAAPEDVLGSGRDLEEAILASCEVWEFFRAKLAQRLDDVWRPFLRAGDELAWRCYQPVRDAALGSAPSFKAPPLVYLNNAWSPLTVRRGRRYEVGSVPQAFLRKQSFTQALARLPFPVVGVPWYQVGYLPDLVAICHEIGHSVEIDFDLSTQVASAVAAAVEPAYVERWQRRGSELFADFYACLCIGPAFAWGLSNILLADAESVTAQGDPSYPSIHERMMFSAAVMRHLGFEDDAATFLKEWHHTYPATVTEDPSQTNEIARHLFGGDNPGDPPGLVLAAAAAGRPRALRDVIRFSPANQQAVLAEVAALNNGSAPQSDDIRVLCACTAFVENPAGTQALLLAAMKAACIDERRNNEARLSAGDQAQRTRVLERSGVAIAKDLLR